MIPGSGRSPGEGNGNPLQYFFLRNCMDRGTWQATVHGVRLQTMGSQKLDATERLNNVNSEAASCGIQLPDQGLNPGPRHWECGVLATGPPGRPQIRENVNYLTRLRPSVAGRADPAPEIPLLVFLPCVLPALECRLALLTSFW